MIKDLPTLNKVGLVEFGGHHEVISSYILIFLAGDVKLTIFCDDFIYNHCPAYHNHPHITWQIADKKPNDYLSGIQDSLASFDLIFITSLDLMNGGFLMCNWPPKTMVMLHDLHIHFAPIRSFFQNRTSATTFLKDTLRLFRSVLNGEFRRRREALSNVPFRLTPSVKVLEYAEKQTWYSESKIVGSFPFYLFEGVQKTTVSHSHPRIVIPGSVSSKSRDYNLVYKVLKQLELEEKIEIVILGKPIGKEGKEIVERIKTLASHHLEIIHFDDYLGQETYDKYLKNADYLLLPLKKTMHYAFLEELQGKTCISGNIHDMVRFATPSIIPDFYPIDGDLSVLVQPYSSATELKSLLELTSKKQLFKTFDTSKPSLENLNAPNRFNDFLALYRSLKF